MAKQKRRGGHEGPTADEIKGRKPLEYERQPDETEEAWLAFVAYRDMDLPRSLRGVGQIVEKSETLMSRWSAQKSWVARAAAWDREKDRLKRDADLKATVAMSARHAKEAAETQRMLALPGIEIVKRYEKAIANGEDPFRDMSMAELIKEATKAARVYVQVGTFERLVRGLSTSNVGGHDGGPLEVEHRERVERMPRDEIETYLLGVDAGAKHVAEKNGLPAPASPPDE